jgi:hypothetical protein
MGAVSLRAVSSSALPAALPQSGEEEDGEDAGVIRQRALT